MKAVAGLVLLGVGVLVGCSGGGGSNSDAAAGAPNGVAGSAGTGVFGAGGSAGSSTPSGAGTANGNGAAGGGGMSASAGSAGADLELPAGSKEVDGVVNLVDAAASAELDQFIVDESLKFPSQRHALNTSLNLFLAHYQEKYDFVFFFTDHLIPDTLVAAKFEPVTSSAGPGGVSALEIAAEGYQTTGRVKGVIGVQYTPGSMPALAHETVHNWANYLDDSFGFGTALDDASSALLHWGYTSVNGQLGGFDGSTLRCETPAGAMPPNCTPLANGRTRYVTGIYAPQTNTFRSVPYAPLELYLMGLIPASEVPPSIQMLTGATFPEFSADGLTAVTEAAGLKTLAFADIQARHGTAKMLPADARHFDAAFVVLSSTPVPDSVLAEVGNWAAVFGNRKVVNGWSSFEQSTGNRATMSTALTGRRKVGTAPPAPRAATSCDLLAQTCSRPELACYLAGGRACALSGNLPLNAPCKAQFSCARGLNCVANSLTPDNLVCSPFCDPSPDSSAALACNTLCPGRFAIYQDAGGVQLGAICVPN